MQECEVALREWQYLWNHTTKAAWKQLEDDTRHPEM